MQKAGWSLVVILLFLFIASAQAAPQDLMPVPASIQVNEGTWQPGTGFQVAFAGFSNARLEHAIARFIVRLRTETGLALSDQIANTAGPDRLAIVCASAGQPYPTLGSDESYTLSVAPNSALLSAPEVIGVLRGLETFLQLIEPQAGGFSVRSVEIHDYPRFRWRGLLLDVCRHWMPPDVVLRQLNAMAALKMNVLHWHLSEDQGFRVESQRFPRLQQLGSDGNYYTHQQIRTIVEYAAERGIRVVPEFDMPGHTTSWFVGYPELASLPGPYEIERHWGVFDPCMDPTRDEVYAFLDEFINEMVQLFPDPVFHIGGDEVNGVQWNTNPAIVSFKQLRNLSNTELQAYFNQRLGTILQKYGKTLAGWDEILASGLPGGSIIQSWRGPASLAQAASLGYWGILSSGYYLDYMLPASYHYSIDPIGQQVAVLPPEAQGRVLGGEACMWGEFVTPANVEGRIWPRAAAIAERLWSPAETRDVHDMYRRLEAAGKRLERWGITYGANSDAMLLDLVNGAAESLDPLRKLARVLKPAEYYYRPHAQVYTSLTALNRMVDAVLPETSEPRDFAASVDRFLADRDNTTAREDVRARLQTWNGNHDVLSPVLQSNARLNEILPVSAKLAQAAQIGLQAIDYIANHQAAPGDWVSTQWSWLDSAGTPEAEMVLLVAPAIKRLVSFAGVASTLGFAHFGDGAGLTSSLLVLNTDPANSVAGLAKVFDDEGLPGIASINDTVEPGFFPFDLSPLRVALFQTSGKGDVWTGAMQVDASGPVAGTVIFSGDFGVAGIGSETASTGFRVPIQSELQGIRTGIAVSNPGAGAVNLDLALRNASGQIVKGTSVSIPGHGHIARFPEELFETGQAGTAVFEGVIDVRASAPVHALAVRTSPGVFATFPAVPLEGADQTLSFPQFANGDGLWSLLVLANPSDVRTATATVKIYDNVGKPLAVAFEGWAEGTFTFVIPPGGACFLRTSASGPLTTGSLEVVSDSPIGGSLIYSGTTGLAGVGSGQRLRRSITPVRGDSRAGVQTGIAVANPGNAEAVVTLTLRTATGKKYTNTRRLSPHGHFAMFLPEVFSKSGVDFGNLLGSVEVTSQSEVSCVAIMTYPGEMATLPVSP